MSGKELRLNRIFKQDGRALVFALDHGLGIGPLPGLINADQTISAAVDGGIDAVLTTVGIASRYPSAFREVSLILRLDGAFSIYTGGLERMDLVYDVETALHIGADAVCCMGFVGGEDEGRTLKYLGEIAAQCFYWQIPLMAEMLVMDQENTSNPEAVALAARTGVESGADFIKTTFTGNADEFRQVVDGCFRPVLVRGGSKQKELELLTSVEQALTAGASGAVIGRNIWQHENPEAMAQALFGVIHEGLNTEQALTKAGLS